MPQTLGRANDELLRILRNRGLLTHQSYDDMYKKEESINFNIGHYWARSVPIRQRRGAVYSPLRSRSNKGRIQTRPTAPQNHCRRKSGRKISISGEAFDMGSPENPSWLFDCSLVDEIPIPGGDFHTSTTNGFYWPSQGFNASNNGRVSSLDDTPVAVCCIVDVYYRG
ncbi:hypothetical protein ACLOJK_039628 [Asimina triloba]